MSQLLDKQIVLSLNSAWQPIGQLSVRAAITAMTGGETVTASGRHQPPAVALDLEIVDGVTIMARPVAWDEWVTLPVRADDLAIHASAHRVIRVPTVVIRPNYKGMPLRSRNLCFNTIWERDGGRCQYTNQQLERDEANLDHVIPAAQGGKKVFENLVLSHKKVNTKKGARRPEEAGLKLLRQPQRPRALPASVVISRQTPGHKDWIPFLMPRAKVGA